MGQISKSVLASAGGSDVLASVACWETIPSIRVNNPQPKPAIHQPYLLYSMVNNIESLFLLSACNSYKSSQSYQTSATEYMAGCNLMLVVQQLSVSNKLIHKFVSL